METFFAFSRKLKRAGEAQHESLHDSPDRDRLPHQSQPSERNSNPQTKSTCTAKPDPIWEHVEELEI